MKHKLKHKLQNYKGEVATFSRTQLRAKQPTKYARYSLLSLDSSISRKGEAKVIFTEIVLLCTLN